MLMFSWFLFLFVWVNPRLPTNNEYTTHPYPHARTLFIFLRSYPQFYNKNKRTTTYGVVLEVVNTNLIN